MEGRGETEVEKKDGIGGREEEDRRGRSKGK